MGFGLPAVGTTAGGAPEVITHEIDGYLIQPGDVCALQQRLLELAHDRGKLLQMSLAAYQRYRVHPTWTLTCKRIREFLLSICKGNK
jgi:glycosyltransferase involved in cell wall biosynthesis